MERPLLILLDVYAIAYRAYFALPVDQFSTSDGAPTNAIFGFTRMLLDILNEEPNYLAVTFDRGLSGRETLYSEYKGTRDKMPDELAQQIPHIEAVAKAFNMPILAIDGYEADDIIGTIAKQAEAQGCRVKIITGDRDLLQLLSEHTVVQLPNRAKGNKGDEVWDLKKYTENYIGLAPDQLPDYKGLVGDSSDNIPGVMGIGEKSALKLLAAYKTVEGIYENLPAVEPRFRMKLEEGREMAFLSKQLATILRELPIELDLKTCVTHDFDGNEVRELFRTLEFRTLSKQFETFLTRRSEYRSQEQHADMPVFIPPHTIVTEEAQLADLVQVLNRAKMIAFDTETTSLDKMAANLVGISLSVDGEHGYYLPVGHISPNVQPSLFGNNDAPPQLPLEKVINALRPAMTDPNIPKTAHNAQFDLVMLRRFGIDVTPITEDTMLAEFVVNPGSKYLGLKNLTYITLDRKMEEIDALIGSGNKQITMDRVPVEKAAGYAAADAVATFLLVNPLRTKLKNQDKNPRAYELYQTLEIPLIPVLANMEMAGVLVDCDYLKELSGEMTARLKDKESEIFQATGREFNVGSYQQLNEILFDHLKLPTDGLSKNKSGGFSLTAAVLEELAERVDHPVLRMIMDYRSLSKLLGTYVDALPLLVNKTTGRVHTSFNQTGAVTGRLSSSNPNLQNIPIRTEEGRQIRRAFIAAPGNLLLSADYSQIELRILAHYSGDETLVQAFANGEDVHRTTAAKVQGIPLDQVTFEQRRRAKQINFGLMYGMGAFRLARDTDLTLAEADAFIKAYFQNFPGVKDFLENTKMMARENGYVETFFGRRRLFPELTREGNRQVQARAEREAINAPIQGTAADIVKRAMINLDHRLREEGYQAQMLIQVHDELLLEVPETEIEAVEKIVTETMYEAGQKLTVPIVAEAHSGKNWYELK